MTSATCATIDVDRVLGEGADAGAGRRLRDSLVTQPGGKRGSLVKQRAFRRATSGDSDATAMLTASASATTATPTASTTQETPHADAPEGRRTIDEADDVVGELLPPAPRRPSRFGGPAAAPSRPRLIDAGAQMFVSEMWDPDDCGDDDEELELELGDLVRSMSRQGFDLSAGSDLGASLTSFGCDLDGRRPSLVPRLRRSSCGLRPASFCDPSLDGRGGPEGPPAGEAPRRPSLVDADAQMFVSEVSEPFGGGEEGEGGEVPVADPDDGGGARRTVADRLRRPSCGYRPASFQDPSLGGPP